MRLSDVIGHMNLWIWPSIAMVLFLGVFVGVLIQVFSKPRQELDAIARDAIRDEPLTHP